MVVVVAALVVGAVVQQRSDSPTSSRQQLARILGAAEDSPRYQMRYNRGGTRVLDCIADNLRYIARVDTTAQRMTITTSDLDEASVIVDASNVLVRRTLFQDAPGEFEWFRVPRPVAATARQTLIQALGVDLAAAVTSDRLPASGNELVKAALSIARSVRRTRSADVGGDTTVGYRILVDRNGYQRKGATLTQKTTMASLLPIFDVWINSGNEVRRVTIGSETDNGEPGPAEDSWTMDFEKLTDVRRPIVTSSGRLSDADFARLRGLKRGCELPIGRTDG